MKISWSKSPVKKTSSVFRLLSHSCEGKRKKTGRERARLMWHEQRPTLHGRQSKECASHARSGSAALPQCDTNLPKSQVRAGNEADAPSQREARPSGCGSSEAECRSCNRRYNCHEPLKSNAQSNRVHAAGRTTHHRDGQAESSSANRTRAAHTQRPRTPDANPRRQNQNRHAAASAARRGGAAGHDRAKKKRLTWWWCA